METNAHSKSIQQYKQTIFEPRKFSNKQEE